VFPIDRSLAATWSQPACDRATTGHAISFIRMQINPEQGKRFVDLKLICKPHRDHGVEASVCADLVPDDLFLPDDIGLSLGV
jgi:hypothetical protein